MSQIQERLPVDRQKRPTDEPDLDESPIRDHQPYSRKPEYTGKYPEGIDDPDDVPIGIENTEYDDLTTLLYGSPGGEITGHQNYERRTDVYDDLGLDPLKYRANPKGFLRAYNELYESKTDGRVMVFEKTNAQEHGGYTTIPATRRGDPEYQAEKGDLFDGVQEHLEQNPQQVQHITLSPRRRKGESTVSMLVRMKGMPNSFISALASHLGHRPQYVWAIEMGPGGGIPHLHMAILEPYIDSGWLNQWWVENGEGGPGGLEHRTVPKGSCEQIVGYLVKYLNEEMGSEYWLAICRLSRLKTFSFSQSLRQTAVDLARHDQVKQEEGEDWVYRLVFIAAGAVWNAIVEEYDGTPPPAPEIYKDHTGSAGLNPQDIEYLNSR